MISRCPTFSGALVAGAGAGKSPGKGISTPILRVSRYPRAVQLRILRLSCA